MLLYSFSLIHKLPFLTGYFGEKAMSLSKNPFRSLSSQCNDMHEITLLQKKQVNATLLIAASPGTFFALLSHFFPLHISQYPQAVGSVQFFSPPWPNWLPYVWSTQAF